MRILITGITGRIGANLAVALVGGGHQVRGLVWARDRRVGKLEGLGVELLEGSLTEMGKVHQAVKNMEIVYHLGAAFQGGGPFTEEEYFQINVSGTFNMLEAARAQKVDQFVFASTDALYDKYIPGGMPDPISEETPRKARSSYALTKVLGEEMCLWYCLGYSLPITVLRFAMVMSGEEVLNFPQFYLSHMKDIYPEVAELWQGEERLVVLKDSQGRYFKKHVSDVRDIVHGCVSALDEERAFGEIVQLGGPSAFTWDEAVYQLTEILRIPHVEVEVSGTPTYYEFDLSKSRRLLKFCPQYDIGRMIGDGLSFQMGEDIGVLPI